MQELLKAQIEEIYEKIPGRPALISLTTAARIVGRRKEFLLADGTFPVKRMGRRWLVPVVALARWILGLR